MNDITTSDTIGANPESNMTEGHVEDNREALPPPANSEPAPEELTDPEYSNGEEDIEEADIVGFDSSDGETTRLDVWERQLLDLSLRNHMLNLRLGRGILPIKDLKPQEVIKLLKSGKLAKSVGQPDVDNAKQLKGLYKASVNKLEENGANSFFITIGSLRWYDVSGTRPHISPIIFIPAEIEQKNNLSYKITLRDDEMMINVTLIEMLRQKFGIVLPTIDSIPTDDDGMPDWEPILEIFRQPLGEINERLTPRRQWSVREDSYAGVFVFQKYLLWHDIHNNPTVITQHPLLSAMIEQHVDLKIKSVDAQKIEANDAAELVLPINYDSSQLEAVAQSHANNSFVLHGPPGTGKSQTISNMIADAICSGKKVLFVSEKKAALDVVRKRLNMIGLQRYCLELHSNKTNKRSFFSQIKAAHPEKIGIETPGEEEKSSFAESANSLTQYRNFINDVTEGIHSPRLNNMSLYDCIDRFAAIKDPDYLNFSYDEIKHLSPSQVKEVCEALASLDLVEQVLRCHPADHPLKGLYPKENTLENQQQLLQVIPLLPAEIETVRKKANGFFNRVLLRKTPEEILFNRPIWKQLCEVTTVDFDPTTITIDKISANINRWKDHLNLLHKWYLFTEKRGRILGLSVPKKVLEFYFEGNTGNATATKLEKGYLKTQIDNMIMTHQSLRMFNGPLHEKYLSDYTHLTYRVKGSAQEKLIQSLRNRISNTVLDDRQLEERAILQRRVFSHGRGVAVRKTIEESQSIIQLLFPCMLMSPLSVAQYLEMRPDMFDLVIFDEASQLETSDAIGAIARGKSLIVVGDPMQLPPTRFFTAQSNSGENGQESVDADSILEECITLGLPSHYLSRHYRSHHESLIAFSNRHFYDNRLLTFPSANDSERKVTFINPNGIYDIGKTRTNRIEAEAVVDHIFYLIRTAKRFFPTIGVVAFSKAQSELIEDILNDRLLTDPHTQHILNLLPESLFVKNLENVQGDERDVIIFSIGYGPDVNGSVSLNFGPINKAGGERRLNVAVTRAREEMAVFSSLLPHHIPEDGNLPKGVVALRNFLKYASDIQEDAPVDEGEVEKESVIDDIANRLREMGHYVQTHVGRSAFKVDIAIVDPDNPNQYKLGIIVDGRDYYKLPTVRDREITVPDVLEQLGWTIKRMWVLDWFENPDLAIKNIFKDS